MSFSFRLFLILISFIIVGWGQPAWISSFGLIASLCGYALFFKAIIDLPQRQTRFYIASAWFAAVQLIQLSWFISHPFMYAYGLLLILSAAMGAQFGFIALLLNQHNIKSLLTVLGLSGIWTTMEWARLFVFSGLSFNPIGIAVTGSSFALQFASLGGVYGLSFWVMLTNLLILRLTFIDLTFKRTALAALIAAFPYIYGIAHIRYYEEKPEQQLSTVVLQTAFPIGEASAFVDRRTMASHVTEQWHQMLAALQPIHGKQIDLIVFPEYVVLCGTYSCIFPLETVKNTVESMFGEEAKKSYPPLSYNFARKMGDSFLVNNAFWAQTIANLFNANLIIGLEDAVHGEDGQLEHFSSAQFFQPDSIMPPERYDKRVLLPLGEYIPFEWCRSLAAKYGVSGTFKHGDVAKIFYANNKPFGASICYEETYGHMMRDNKLLGASFLVNLTSDVWYPDSKLSPQHYYHARLRTVENGFPLIRSANLGVSGVVDSFGREIATVSPIELQGGWKHEAKRIEVPLINYRTLYTFWGDYFVIVLSIFFGVLWAIRTQGHQGRQGQQGP